MKTFRLRHNFEENMEKDVLNTTTAQNTCSYQTKPYLGIKKLDKKFQNKEKTRLCSMRITQYNCPK